jgi:drug/metabolite transporter (DMT)-like permease
MKKEAFGYSQIIIAQVLFSFMYIFVRYVESFGVYNLAFARVFLAAIFLLLFSFFYKKYSIQKPSTQRGRLLFFGAIHGLILIASYLSIYLLPLSTAMLIQATMPIWMAILASILLNEKIKSKTIWAIAISFLGLVILLYKNDTTTNLNLLGIVASLFVAIFGGLVYVLSKTFKKYNGVSLTFWQNLIAAPLLVPLLFFQRPIISLTNILFVFFLVLFGTAAFVLLFVGIRKVRAGNAGVLTLLNYVLTIVLGIFFLQEVPSIKEIIGGVLVLIGIFIILYNPKN